jgi:hypothetical protein
MVVLYWYIRHGATIAAGAKNQWAYQIKKEIEAELPKK